MLAGSSELVLTGKCTSTRRPWRELFNRNYPNEIFSLKSYLVIDGHLKQYFPLFFLFFFFFWRGGEGGMGISFKIVILSFMATIRHNNSKSVLAGNDLPTEFAAQIFCIFFYHICEFAGEKKRQTLFHFFCFLG